MKNKTIDFQQLKQDWLTNPEVKKEYEGLASEYQIARELIQARIKAGLSQLEVANKMHTTQSVIARLESGKTLPSLRTIQKFANAIGGKALVQVVN